MLTNILTLEYQSDAFNVFTDPCRDLSFIRKDSLPLFGLFINIFGTANKLLGHVFDDFCLY